jgi:hypothetical protein
MSEIIPGVWIGNNKHASNHVFINQNDISVIISCSTKKPRTCIGHIEHLEIPIDEIDVDYQPSKSQLNTIYEYINDVTIYIYKKITAQQNILIHCNDGYQRSPTIIATFLMKYCDCSIDKSISIIRSKRENSFRPEPTFIGLLKVYKKMLH